MPPLVNNTWSECIPVTCAEQLADSFTGIFEHTARGGQMVLAGRVETRFAPTGAHCLDDFRQNRRRGVMVEVNWPERHGSHA